MQMALENLDPDTVLGLDLVIQGHGHAVDEFRGPISDVSFERNSITTFHLAWVARKTEDGGYTSWKACDKVTFGPSFSIKTRGSTKSNDTHLVIFDRDEELLESQRVDDRSTDRLRTDISIRSKGKVALSQIANMPNWHPAYSSWDRYFPKVQLSTKQWLALEQMPDGLLEGGMLKDALDRMRTQDGYAWPHEQRLLQAVGRIGYFHTMRNMESLNPLIDNVVGQLIDQGVDLHDWSAQRR